MIPTKALLALLPFLSSTIAVAPPSYSGWRLVNSDQFGGAAGSTPNEGFWNIITGDIGVNNELQVYSRSSRNVQLSGGSTLQLVPWRDGSQPKGWTSGRMESKYTFTPTQGKVTRAEAQLRFGPGSTGRKKGIWPAWWMLGDAIRRGTGWPACGEIDIMETVNGELTGHGTIHCHVSPGGICNEGTGIGNAVGIPDQGWHTWRVDINRESGNWRDQSITWYLDGRQFHQVTGQRINDEGVWRSLAQSPLFFIVNVAVGGNWPGNPDGNTVDGYDSMMEVGYVAHYTT